MNRCASCGRAVLWVLTPAGKRNPLDALTGRWLILGDGPDQGVCPPLTAADARDLAAVGVVSGQVVRGRFADDTEQGQLETWDGNIVYRLDRNGDPVGPPYVRVFKSHFATCGQADQHRKAR